jgi:hypothetical protein
LKADASAPSGYLLKTAAASTYIPLLGNLRIKQIVQGTTSTLVTSSTSTFVDTGLTATITPTNASNKIIVLANTGVMYKAAGNVQNSFGHRLLRGATVISAQFGAGYTGTSVDLYFPGHSIMIFDSPTTTSATTYKTQFSSQFNAASVGVNPSGSTSHIILIEVEG